MKREEGKRKKLGLDGWWKMEKVLGRGRDKDYNMSKDLGKFFLRK